MKIGMVSPFFPPFVGGAEIVAGKAADLLALRGHTIEVHTLRHDPSLPLTEVLASGPTIHRYDYRIQRRMGFTDMQAPMLVEAMQMLQADAVHIHSVTFPALLTRAARALRARSVPMFIVTHGVVEALQGEHQGLKRVAYRTILPRLLQSLFEQVQAVAVLSPFDQEILKVSRIRLPYQSVVGNGVNLPILESLTNEPSDHLHLLHVASIKPNKGHMTVLGALPSIPFPVIYHIVGSGGDLWHDFEALVDQSVAQIPNRHQVIKHGRVTDREKEDLYHLADVVVVPSFSETLPLAVLEGMSYAKPVLATRVGGIPHLIRDHKTGILIDPDNPAQLAAALTHLQSPSIRETLGQAGRTLVQQEFTWDRVLDRYEALTEHIVSHVDSLASKSYPPG